MRFIVEELRPSWVREFYAVEIDNSKLTADEEENRELVKEAFYDCESDNEYLGHNVEDRVESVSSEIDNVTAMPAGDPFMLHPVLDRDVQDLVDAAWVVLAEAVKLGEVSPRPGEDDDNDLPVDEKGVRWYDSYFALREALKKFLPEQASRNV